ncbi:MAG: pantoate--beta-alanine ligase [Thermoguttaceae bacterium]|jgi:pantoate--beta-alanine ligase
MDTQPQLITSIADLRSNLSAARKAGKRIGLVPTMGALHEGHLSLVRASKAQCGLTVVSIYVNPTQFGPREDLAKYPRTLQSDLEALAALETELVFAPGNEEMYPAGYCTWVEPGEVAEPLEGQCRSGHFRGVATVVLKLFEIVRPDAAYFGQKDYQQALVIRRMVRDLNVPVEIVVCPIVREPDGLAMSSRNRYLSPAARGRALVLWKSLQLAGGLVAQGERNVEKIVGQMRKVILTAEDARIDYIALVDPETLQPVLSITGRTLAALAVTIENTRLIDNCLLEV